MTTANRFELFPCSFVHAGGTLNLAQMQQFAVQIQGQYTRVRPGGTVRTLANLLARAKPRAQFQTRDLATFFGTVSAVTGLHVSQEATFRLEQREEGAVFATGSEHVEIFATAGLMVPVSLSAEEDSQDGANLQVQYVARYDGTNRPFQMRDAVDFGAKPAPAFSSQFYLGPVYNNGAEIKGVTRSTVEFGITIEGVTDSPQAYDKSLCIVDINPQLVFTTRKADTNAALSLFARALTASFAFYFQRGAASSDRVAAATPSHCKVSCTAGTITVDDIEATAGQDAMTQFTIKPTSDLAISVGSAIP